MPLDMLINVIFRDGFVPYINGDDFVKQNYTHSNVTNYSKFYIDVKKIFTKYSILFTTEHGKVHHVVTFKRASELALAMSCAT